MLACTCALWKFLAGFAVPTLVRPHKVQKQVDVKRQADEQTRK